MCFVENIFHVRNNKWRVFDSVCVDKIKFLVVLCCGKILKQFVQKIENLPSMFVVWVWWLKNQTANLKREILNGRNEKFIKKKSLQYFFDASKSWVRMWEEPVLPIVQHFSNKVWTLKHPNCFFFRNSNETLESNYNKYYFVVFPRL